eukprot:6647835-Pyramimonas_sp.AAC.1
MVLRAVAAGSQPECKHRPRSWYTQSRVKVYTVPSARCSCRGGRPTRSRGRPRSLAGRPRPAAATAAESSAAVCVWTRAPPACTPSPAAEKESREYERIQENTPMSSKRIM